MKLDEAFEILGVSEECEEEEAKTAYRKLAMMHHPDKNPDNKEESTAKFQQIGAARPASRPAPGSDAPPTQPLARMLAPGEAYARVQRYHETGDEDDDEDDYNQPSAEDLQDLFEMLIGGLLSGQLGGGRGGMFGPGGHAGESAGPMLS